MRVMLDTNILVSAFVFRSKQIYAVIDYIVLNHELLLPSYVINELKDVVNRKFPKLAGNVDEFLATLSFTLVHTPRNMQSGLFRIRDISDAPILYTAIIKDADILITGDKDFSDICIKRPVIMTASGFKKSYMIQ